MLEVNVEDIYSLCFTQYNHGDCLKKDEELGRMSGYMGKLVVYWKCWAAKRLLGRPRHRWEDNTWTHIDESNVAEKGLNLTKDGELR